MHTKLCRHCGIVKPITEFHTRNDRKSGRGPWCKNCKAEYRKDYYSRNKQRETAQIANYYRKHEEELRKKQAERRSNNPEKAKEINRKSKEKNYEKYQRRWRSEESKSRARDSSRKLRAGDPEKYREKNRREQAIRWFAAKANPISYALIYKRDKGVCYICSKPVNREDCHFDHIIPLSKGGEHSYENVKVTHSRCNLSKGAKIIPSSDIT